MHACLRLDARVCGCMHGEHSPCAKLARATRACTHACTCVCAWMHACVSLEHPPWEELTIWGKADRPRDGLQRVDCRRVGRSLSVCVGPKVNNPCQLTVSVKEKGSRGSFFAGTPRVFVLSHRGGCTGYIDVQGVSGFTNESGIWIQANVLSQPTFSQLSPHQQPRMSAVETDLHKLSFPA